MKDKRQKMTLSWPCGDPVLAAYVLQAAAASGQLPYPGLFAAAAAASSPFGLMQGMQGLPPRPPPPPHPYPPTSGFPCRPTPTLIPPPPPHPALLLDRNDRNDRKSPIEEVTTSEDETATRGRGDQTNRTSPNNSTELTITVSDKTRNTSTSGGGANLFQPYLDLEKK